MGPRGKEMNLKTILLAASALAICVTAAPTEQDPLNVDSSIYNLKLSNDRVRAFIVQFKPGQSIAVHKHPDHVVHAITAGRIMIHEVGKEPMEMDVAAGTTLFLPAQSHSAKNTGKTTLRLFVVELKEPMKMK
jgi:quercetin dioxygenase-like cupin family protein